MLPGPLAPPSSQTHTPCPLIVQLLLCATLLLAVVLATRVLSAMAGIKLKRMNHRQRMLELSKRVRCALFVCSSESLLGSLFFWKAPKLKACWGADLWPAHAGVPV